LDVEKYINGLYDPELLNQVVAWHNINSLISNHMQDAVSAAHNK